MALHATSVGLVCIPAVFGDGFPGIPYDDVYIPTLIYPGWIMWYLSSVISSFTDGFLSTHFNSDTACYLAVVWLPAVVSIMLGAPVWYFIGIFLNFSRQHDKEVNNEGTYPQQ